MHRRAALLIRLAPRVAVLRRAVLRQVARFQRWVRLSTEREGAGRIESRSRFLLADLASRFALRWKTYLRSNRPEEPLRRRVLRSGTQEPDPDLLCKLHRDGRKGRRLVLRPGRAHLSAACGALPHRRCLLRAGYRRCQFAPAYPRSCDESCPPTLQPCASWQGVSGARRRAGRPDRRARSLKRRRRTRRETSRSGRPKQSVGGPVRTFPKAVWAPDLSETSCGR